ncbi:unnamed protein product [Heligmosomoides polygyrus]|uniref:Ion channel n=1 Tax=Heligmosomoides polygyrus TaxID=6339 RepID=A0A3P7XCM2_HELPZ|nr:unnamed protein product [Heligmosomoides polygyrus]
MPVRMMTAVMTLTAVMMMITDCYTDQIFCMEACYDNLKDDYKDRTKRLACFSPCRDTFTKCLGEDKWEVN